jgi:hypothetical protein
LLLPPTFFPQALDPLFPLCPEHFRSTILTHMLQGEIIDTKVKSDLLYNEFIVYDTAQCFMRYLVHFEFDFGQKKKKFTFS